MEILGVGGDDEWLILSTRRGVTARHRQTGRCVSQEGGAVGDHIARCSDGRFCVVGGGGSYTREVGGVLFDPRERRWSSLAEVRGTTQLLVDRDRWWAAAGEFASTLGVATGKLGQKADHEWPGEELPAVRTRLRLTDTDAWVLFPGPADWRPCGHGLARIDKQTFTLTTYGPEDGLAGEYVTCAAPWKADLWVAASGTYHDKIHVLIAPQLCRYDGRTGRWIEYPRVGDGPRDEITAIKVIGEDVWVGSRGYAELGADALARYYRDDKLLSPIVTHLAVSRYLPQTDSWESHRLPAEHSAVAIKDLWVAGDLIWLVVDRTERWVRPWNRKGPSGRWLLSYNRATGQAKWHGTMEWGWWPEGQRRAEPVCDVVDGVFCVAMDGALRWYEPRSAEWRQAEIPSALPHPVVKVVEAVEDVVYFATQGGCVGRIGPEGRPELLARLLISGPTVRVSTLFPSMPPQGGEVGPVPPEPPPNAWGHGLPAEVEAIAADDKGRVWFACRRGSRNTGWVLMSMGPGYWEAPAAPPGVRDVFARAGVAVLDGDRWLVPEQAPWSYRERARSGTAQLVAAREPTWPPGAKPRHRDVPGGPRVVDAYRAEGHARGGTPPAELGVASLLALNGQMLIGTIGDGVYVFDAEADACRRLGPGEQRTAPGPATVRSAREVDPAVSAPALAASDSALWVLNYAGLYRCDLPTGRSRKLAGPDEVPDDAGRFANEVHARRRYADDLALSLCGGSLWFPAPWPWEWETKVVHRIAPDGGELQRVEPDLHARVLLPDDAGRLWASSYQEQVLRFDPSAPDQRARLYRPDLVTGAVHDLAWAGDDLWIATDSGLVRIARRTLNEELDEIGGR
jgi:hypothetical protein